MNETQFKPEDADRALKILNDAVEDLYARNVPVVAADLVWDLLVDAARTIESLPDQDRRWLSSGSRSGGWNMIGMSSSEARAIEKARLMSGIMPGDALKMSAQAVDVDRAIDVIEWLRFCQSERRGLVLQKSAYWAAAGHAMRAQAHFRPAAPKKQRTLNKLMLEIKAQATGLILLGFTETFGITQGPDGTFERNVLHVG